MQTNSDISAARGGFEKMEIRGAREHNLKNVNLDIPRGKIVAFTGRSGSGKSSLAFDTIYAEGYRKYMESLSADARRLLSQIDKPAVESIRGLSPVIAIEQVKSLGSNPRSTLATLTEIADYARVLWSIAGEQRCPKDGGKISRRSVDECVDAVLALPQGSRVYILAPRGSFKPAAAKAEIKSLRQRAWQRARLNGEIFELDDPAAERELFEKFKSEKLLKLDLVIDRFPLSSAARGRIADSLELALREGADKALAAYSAGDKSGELVLSTAFACEKCGEIYAPLTVRNFSFNHPDGACKFCGGIGRVMRTSEKLAVPDDSKSVAGGAIKAWRVGAKSIIIAHNRILRQLAEQIPFDTSVPWRDLPAETRKILLYGDDSRTYFLRLKRGNCKAAEVHFGGVLAEVDRLCAETTSDGLRARLSVFQMSSECPVCGGARFSERTRNVFVEGVSYDKFCAMSVAESLAFVKSLESLKKYDSVRDAGNGLRDRLGFLNTVGLSYISLDREASTLSGGEAQRARLATQLGMDLTGVTYVLDEPTIGLHPSDDAMLIGALKTLKDRGNSVLLVEHDEAALRAADWVVELGPEAGEKGGELTFNGTLADCLKSKTSRTGMYLSGRAKIGRPSPRLSPANGWLTIKKARENNLKNIDVKFPVGLFTVVCGVSGSGKSTLVNDILAKAAAAKLNGAKEIAGAHGGIAGFDNFDTCVRVDQSPIGKSPRSNPATYTKLFDLLRELYAQTPLAKMRGYSAGRFSFNVKGGRCEHCRGDGSICLDMQFLGEVYITCPSCGGKRYNRETLEVRYKGLNIAEALNLTVDEALGVFAAHPRIVAKLKTLSDVGLGYIRLGQPANTLSGGEAQRIKLSLELSRRTHGRALYILDEPTTGLHWDDIDKLLKLLFELRDAGNTIIVIEHHPDFVKLADWLVELGPTGGAAGGNAVFEGTFDELKSANTPTAKFVR
ncbi:MAG: excinuclease ABC subunit UvrA [Candidatus Merdousia sp.]|nr:excinuclease ABC subunit UvrA [Candidatus Merdousia sp.]